MGLGLASASEEDQIKASQCTTCHLAEDPEAGGRALRTGSWGEGLVLS